MKDAEAKIEHSQKKEDDYKEMPPFDDNDGKATEVFHNLQITMDEDKLNEPIGCAFVPFLNARFKKIKHSEIPALTEKPETYVWVVTSKKTADENNTFWLKTEAFPNPEDAVKAGDKQFRAPNKFIITSTITDLVKITLPGIFITSVGRLLFEKFYYDRNDEFVGGIKRISLD